MVHTQRITEAQFCIMLRDLVCHFKGETNYHVFFFLAVNTFFNLSLFHCIFFNLFSLSKTIAESCWMFEVKQQSRHQKPYLVKQVIYKKSSWEKWGHNDDVVMMKTYSHMCGTWINLMGNLCRPCHLLVQLPFYKCSYLGQRDFLQWLYHPWKENMQHNYLIIKGTST